MRIKYEVSREAMVLHEGRYVSLFQEARAAVRGTARIGSADASAIWVSERGATLDAKTNEEFIHEAVPYIKGQLERVPRPPR